MDNFARQNALNRIKEKVNFPWMLNPTEIERWLLQHLAGTVITVYKGYVDLLKMSSNPDEIKELSQSLEQNNLDTLLFDQYNTYGLNKSDISDALSAAESGELTYFQFIMHHAEMLDRLVKESIQSPELFMSRQVNISHLIHELQEFLEDYENDYKTHNFKSQ